MEQQEEKESLKDVPAPVLLVEDTDITHHSRGDGLIASNSVEADDGVDRSRSLGGALSGPSTNALQGSDAVKAAKVADTISTGIGLPLSGSTNALLQDSDPPKGLQSSFRGPSHHRLKSSDSTKKGLSGSARGRSRDRILSSDSYKGLSHSAARDPTRSRIGNVYKKKGDEIVIGSGHQVPAPRSIGFELEPEEEATWSDVYRACCCHTGSEWMKISSFLFSLLLLFYFFLVGLDLLGTSFAVVGGCNAGSLLGSDTSPLASVMIGVIATALLQSSSTTTAIVVSLVSGGLDVNQAIYMVMGANVGTTITAMLVSLAHISDPDELERAFAGSSMDFIFNFLTILILFPLEIGTGYLDKLTQAMLPSSVGEGDSWEGPIKQIVGPLVKTFIIANKDLIEETASDEGACKNRYPIQCSGSVNYDNCQETAGAIGCNEKTGICPVFFQVGASKKDDMVSGWVCLVIALFILIMCLVGLVGVLRKVLLGASTRILYKATNINGIIAIAIGCGVTILVQSSSITSSTLVPLAGVGVLRLEKMYPLQLGADIGTTFTALMAAMVSSKIESLQIALVHLFFNLTGIAMWYPIPFMRNVVYRFARFLGKTTSSWRGFPIVFILMVFLVLPLLLLGISACFEKKTTGFTALGSFLLLLVVGCILYFYTWWKFRNGNEKFREYIERRQRHAAALEALADDLDYLKVDMEWSKNEIGRIKDYAGLVPTLMGMEEEGPRPVVTVISPEDEEMEDLELTQNEEDDRLSLYESCQSRPWRDIFFAAAGSIKSGLGSTTQPQL